MPPRGTSLATGYAANIWLRSAIRVLVHVAEGPVDGRKRGGDEIYRFFRACADWPEIIEHGQAISVEARARGCSDIPSALLLQARARDAICDAIRDARRPRPAPPEPGQAAEVPLYVTAWQDYLTVYRDMSGESLHRRGYRSAMHRASLNESAAAGCLLLAGWPEAALSGATLADPMCGSGTFLIEAALMATNTAPGLFRRRFPFQGWHDFDRQAYASVCEQARKAQTPWEGALLGNEIHPGALSLASRDAEGAGVAHLMHLHQGSCGEWQPRQRPDQVITNPPWGNRLMDAEADDSSALEATWTELGLFLKAHCREAQAFVLSGNKSTTQWLRMKADNRTPLTIGGADCRLIKYTVLPAKQPTAAVASGGRSAV
ncbi:hypothetical protein CVIRNUC_007708 [Coccomyxa viridis]|uniref:Ribosomal RNA large subunit methyltransferase K/L-like methyltransferase domain-containing protein n=1 Tax=Coccomyxa viridis TaxID=1274662 RepID=A0AAV1IES5_9CHLO|nr:hypothetical protein CVIRNUC_007708 [Coccomyxa viridis]